MNRVTHYLDLLDISTETAGSGENFVQGRPLHSEENSEGVSTRDRNEYDSLRQVG